MGFQEQLIYLFSSVGALNGFLLSFYILIRKAENKTPDYFLGALLIALSFRVIKSVFRFFNPNLFETFVEIGLGACALIGPLLFLYVCSLLRPRWVSSYRWILVLLPVFLIYSYLSFQYSYYDDRIIWGWIIEMIYKFWLLCIVISVLVIRPILFRMFHKDKKLTDEDIWLLNIVFGVAMVYVAYDTIKYTSYIVGALSFTFILYISLILWFYKRKNKKIAHSAPEKYANSGLNDEIVTQLFQRLEKHMINEKPYLDPDLKLAKLAEHLGLNSKELSQVINQEANKNYSRYVAEYRVDEAERMLNNSENAHLKISSIAYSSGFNSLSSFNSYFKKIKGYTAASLRN